jgi:4-amino-4-deoxy-L-arabinose transferase-like glycosyltransferase
MFTKTDIEKYFAAEKLESLFFIIIGIVAVILAIIFFFFLKTNFYKGVAVPLLLIAAIQITVGYTVYKRCDEDRKRNTYAYDLNPGELRLKEIPRMEKVNSNFILYRWIEIALTICGIILLFLYKENADKKFWYGIGVGLAIQALIMLSLDYFAEARAKVYTNGLREVINKK